MFSFLFMQCLVCYQYHRSNSYLVLGPSGHFLTLILRCSSETQHSQRHNRSTAWWSDWWWHTVWACDTSETTVASWWAKSEGSSYYRTRIFVTSQRPLSAWAQWLWRWRSLCLQYSFSWISYRIKSLTACFTMTESCCSEWNSLRMLVALEQLRYVYLELCAQHTIYCATNSSPSHTTSCATDHATQRHKLGSHFHFWSLLFFSP